RSRRAPSLSVPRHTITLSPHCPFRPTDLHSFPTRRSSDLVPDHYELVPGQEIPGEVKITDDNPAVTVKVTPKLDPVTDPAKLNKSISRTITINKPGEKPQVINQTATFKRTGKTNEVTGITTYTPWVLDQNGLTTVSAPEVPGYTPSQKTVASVDNPTANTKLTDVTINYTANSQTTHINY